MRYFCAELSVFCGVAEVIDYLAQILFFFIATGDIGEEDFILSVITEGYVCAGEGIHLSVHTVYLRRHIKPEADENYKHDGIRKNGKPYRRLIVLNVPFHKRSLAFGKCKLFFKIRIYILAEHVNAADDYFKFLSVRRFDGENVVSVDFKFGNFSVVEKVDNVSVCRGVICV